MSKLVPDLSILCRKAAWEEVRLLINTHLPENEQFSEYPNDSPWEGRQHKHHQWNERGYYYQTGKLIYIFLFTQEIHRAAIATAIAQYNEGKPENAQVEMLEEDESTSLARV